MRKGFSLIELMIVIAILVILISLIVSFFSSNWWAKTWGGTITVTLPVNTKLVNATWKGSNLWYLTRPSRKGETAETSTLHEQSNLGMIQGQVIFVETSTSVEK